MKVVCHNLTFALTLTLLLSTPGCAGTAQRAKPSPVIEVQILNPSVLPGQDIVYIMRVSNPSTTPIKLARGRAIAQGIFTFNKTSQTISLGILNPTSASFTYDRSSGAPITLPPGGEFLVTHYRKGSVANVDSQVKYWIPLMDAGEWSFKIVMEGVKRDVIHGPEEKEVVACDDCWGGRAESNSVTFEVVNPVNLDAQQQTKRVDELIPAVNQYPTTGYTAYLLCSLERGEVTKLDIRDIVENRAAGASGAKRYEIHDGATVGSAAWDRNAHLVSFAEYAAWRDAAFDTALKSHPDLWCADGLRLQQAYDLLSLQKDDEAMRVIQAVAGDEKSRYRSTAMKFLELLRDANLVQGKASGR